MRLQTILKPNPQICKIEELYFHKQSDCMRVDGFFNLFYIKKRKKYTSLSKLFLKLCLKGWSEIHLMHDQEEIEREQLIATEERQYTFQLPYAKMNTGVFWFWLKQDVGTLKDSILEGYYEGISDNYNQVNIITDICTYRREDYVLRNMETICKHVFANSELEVRDHLQVLLVDNGNTLEQHKKISALIKTEPNISIYPNPNAGGAGGFARGMLEAIDLNEKGAEFTHLLLMDDDAVFDPDLFVRLYGFLAQLDPKYRKLIIGGSLMREDYPQLQYACGEKFKNFSIQNLFPMKDMCKFSNCMSDYMQQVTYPKDTYSGWWCCCYSMETIRRDNLPIPLFIHHDDIEYGIRNQKNGIVFLNGIGVWHRGFELTFAGANRYYDVRNALITTALHDCSKSWWHVLKYVWKSMTRMLISYRYEEAELSCLGLLDFCRGPKWLWKQEPEVLNNHLRSRIRLESNENLRERLGERQFTEVMQKIKTYTDKLDIQQIVNCCDKKITLEMIKKILTFNGWFLPAKRDDNNGIKIISAMDSPFEAYREKEVILFEPFSQKATIARRDYYKLVKILKLYVVAVKAAIIDYQKAARAYREEIGEITSYKSWKSYLKI